MKNKSLVKFKTFTKEGTNGPQVPLLLRLSWARVLLCKLEKGEPAGRVQTCRAMDEWANPIFGQQEIGTSSLGKGRPTPRFQPLCMRHSCIPHSNSPSFSLVLSAIIHSSPDHIWASVFAHRKRRNWILISMAFFNSQNSKNSSGIFHFFANRTK